MAFDNGYTAVTGGTLSAAQWNTYVRDNFTALWPFTTAGDIAYAASATGLSRLGLGAAYKGLIVNSAGNAPEWNHPAIVVASHADTTEYTYNSSTERNMPNSSATLTTLVTSTVIMVAQISGYTGASANVIARFWAQIDGTKGQVSGWSYGSGEGRTVVAMAVKTGVTAGSKTLLIREAEAYGAGNNYQVDNKQWVAIAIPTRS